MCTIGATNDKDRLIIFKQCDLKDKVTFNLPELRGDERGIRYLAFTRQNSKGLWAGVNSCGVAFVAADAYMQGLPVSTYARHSGEGNVSAGDIFATYEKIVSNCRTAKEAMEMMSEFYENFDDPDILMICDRTNQYFIETNKRTPLVIPLFDPKFEQNNYFASTNHFRFLHGGTTFPENHSTYLRLQRADTILQQKPNEAGVNELLKDQYYGPSVLSVCRDKKICPAGEEPYFTQATAYFVLEKSGVQMISASFQVNGNPRSNPFETFNPFLTMAN